MPRSIPSAFSLLLAATLAAPCAYAARQDGLVAYLTFDDENEPLKNLVSSPAVAVEPTKIGESLEPHFTEGRFGKAALFENNPNGKSISDWAISLGKLDQLYAGSFTVSCWIKLPAAQNGVIIGNKEAFNIASGWSMTARSGKQYLVQPLGGSAMEGATNGLERVWRNLVFSVNRATGVASVFVDGKKASDFKLPAADAKLGEDFPTVIGASSNGTLGVKCAVDEVGIWNRVLSETEIAALGSDKGGDGKHGKRIPEASSYAWAGLATIAGFAAVARRRRAKTAKVKVA